MQIEDAKEKALRILEEEQINPTVNYEFVPENKLLHVQALLESLSSQTSSRHSSTRAGFNLFTERQHRPRSVHKSPRNWELSCENYKWLRAIYEQVHDQDRSEFIKALLALVPTNRYWNQGTGSRFPSYLNNSSCLPLVAEFCVRTGHSSALFDVLQIPELPTPGLAMMLMQLEEMISLNYDLFSDNELEKMPDQLAHLRQVAERQTWTSSRPRSGGPERKNPHFKPGFKAVGREVADIVDALFEECRQARIYYLKDELTPRTNLEIESDRGKVEGFLTKLGFSPDMIGALNAAEKEYRTATTNFELKNSFAHLRSFLEHLHRQSAKAMAAAANQQVDDRWGPATIYLRNSGLFSQQHESFVTSLYTLMSDTTVHPLGADRDYARLIRNVVIEYGVIFLRSLDKKGVRITRATAQMITGTAP